MTEPAFDFCIGAPAKYEYPKISASEKELLEVVVYSASATPLAFQY